MIFFIGGGNIFDKVGVVNILFFFVSWGFFNMFIIFKV